MNTLVSAFLIQLVMCAVLFAMLYNFVTANAKLKKDIEAEKLKAAAKS